MSQKKFSGKFGTIFFFFYGSERVNPFKYQKESHKQGTEKFIKYPVRTSLCAHVYCPFIFGSGWKSTTVGRVFSDAGHGATPCVNAQIASACLSGLNVYIMVHYMHTFVVLTAVCGFVIITPT